MKKTIDITDVIATIPSGATLMIGGFMGIGTPSALIDELVRQNTSQLTLIVNDTARPEVGVGKLIDAELVARVITSHIGTNPETQRQMLAGTLLVELIPQGTLAEQIRSGGFGLGGVLTPTGIGTTVANGKQIVIVDDKQYLLEPPLKCDFALIKAPLCDYLGNIKYRFTGQNFNPLMAMAANTVIVEVNELVPAGCIPPDDIHTPGALVDHIVKIKEPT